MGWISDRIIKHIYENNKKRKGELHPLYGKPRSKETKKKISEKELFDLTPIDASYDAIYLCSAMVLAEYRRQGIAKKLTIDAVSRIQADHPVKNLFVWAFSDAGNAAAKALSEFTGLPLFNRE